MPLSLFPGVSSPPSSMSCASFHDAVLPRLAGSICSGCIPSLTHQTDREDRRAMAFDAKGTPLSLRILRGSPYSSKSRVKQSFVSETRQYHGHLSRKEPRFHVAHGKGITVYAVSHPKLALVIDGPCVVGFLATARVPRGACALFSSQALQGRAA